MILYEFLLFSSLQPCNFLDVVLQVWDHIFLGKPAPANCAIPADLLARMRREFEYWYPFDLRVSGKVRHASSTSGADTDMDESHFVV
jgi:leucyl-tRNA synthetase